MNLSLQKELQRWALNIGVKEVTKFSGPTPTKQYLQTLQHVNIKKSQKLGFQSCKFTHHRNNLLDFRHPPVTTRFAKINKQDNEAKSQIDSSMNKKAPNLLNNIKICSIPLKIFGCTSIDYIKIL